MTLILNVDYQSASLDIWDKKYRLKDISGKPIDLKIEDTFKRVAKALAEVEQPSIQNKWEKEFFWALSSGAIPAGRIMSNAGAGEHKPATSSINCTVSGSTKVSYSLQSYSTYYYEEANNTDWEEYGLELSSYYHQVPVSFAVYFELHPVTVHQ